MVEREALAGLQATDPVRLVELAFHLLDSEAPALGILVTRSILPIASVPDAITIADPMVQTRDRLGLPVDDPFDEILDRRLLGDDTHAGGSSKELKDAQDKLESKTREVRQLTHELERLHLDLQARAQQQPPPSLPSASAPLPTTPSRIAEPIPDDGASAELRKRLDELRKRLKERHTERNQLRRELQDAHAQIESLSKRSGQASPDDGSSTERHEDQLLLPAEEFSNQPVRLPEFPRKFAQTLAGVPKPTARACLGLVGRLAGGDAAAFGGSKRLKMAPGIHRQRVGTDYRLLFRLHPDRLEVVDLVNRRDLERRIKAFMH